MTCYSGKQQRQQHRDDVDIPDGGCAVRDGDSDETVTTMAMVPAQLQAPFFFSACRLQLEFVCSN